MHRRNFSASRNAGSVAADSDRALIILAALDVSFDPEGIQAPVNKGGFATWLFGMLRLWHDRQKMWHKRRAAPTPQQGCRPEIGHTGDRRCAGRRPSSCPGENGAGRTLTLAAHAMPKEHRSAMAAI
jgi:hypothetical protein